MNRAILLVVVLVVVGGCGARGGEAGAGENRGEVVGQGGIPRWSEVRDVRLQWIQGPEVDADGLRRVLDSAVVLAELRDPTWHYAPWYRVAFETDGGRYEGELFLGGRGLLTGPGGGGGEGGGGGVSVSGGAGRGRGPVRGRCGGDGVFVESVGFWGWGWWDGVTLGGLGNRWGVGGV